MMDIEIVSRAEAHEGGLPVKAKRRRLPPDPEGLNKFRSNMARLALNAYVAETRNDASNVVSALVADLMHFCDRFPEHGTGLTEVERGIEDYLIETAEFGPYAEIIHIG